MVESGGRIGDETPDLQVDAYHGDEVRKIKLSDYRGNRLCAIVHPADFSFAQRLGFHPDESLLRRHPQPPDGGLVRSRFAICSRR